ncbi:LOW QUALITY PROTEIN: hypothetical protein U9M48_008586, partial [Paspalum notatum var. saurae]
MEDFSKKLERLEAMMQKTLDAVSGLESWRETADKSFGALLKLADEAGAWLHSLETTPPSPPPPPPPPPRHQVQPPPQAPPPYCDPFNVPLRLMNLRPQTGGSGLFDLNLPLQGMSRSYATGVENAHGHRFDHDHRDAGGGILGSRPPHPVTGTSSQNDFHFPEHQDSPHHRTAPYPKLEFPKFDGDNPRLWRDRCQMYFEVYAVADALKTRFAALNFSGAAATWLQTIECKEWILDWDHLCSLVFTRFDKNQYQLQLRQLDSLKQTGSVQEYQERFEQLSHGILLYNAAYDETYFVTRFLGGLREDIRAPIALHRPKDVDTASALALLQEEELENVKKKTVQKGDSKDFSKFGQKWTAEKFKSTPRKEESTKVEKDPFDEKLSALKAFRKANGLCFKCGDKWGQNHKCPKKIPLHVLEEFLEVFELQDIQVSESDGEDNSGNEGVCAVEQSPLQATQKFRTLKLLGRIGKYHFLILIDSGSIGTFVSDELVSRLQLPTVPGGSQLAYSGFTSDARVLPLRCYDMILGEDWLESCSPMWVDWKLKQMAFTVAGQKVALQDITDDVTNCSAISVHKLKGLVRQGAITHCIQWKEEVQLLDATLNDVSTIEHSTLSELPSVVQAVIQDFEHLFANPTSLPPHRQADHMIPLLPGSQPIKIRPYRYSPVQKDEIEAQLKEMLNQGVIRHSSSSFASPVLLVKKKDGSWRLCVDYRHLNAITEKNKHPMPMVDELLDELAGAQWFSKLDFRSGYHQIRMAPGEEYKTAFCTHSGLYEFLVMPFGLTNAPTTFQSLMNHIFVRLLRERVLVFMDDILIYSKSLQEHVVLLKQVFEILQENQFLIKWSKCSFAQSSIEYLGHITAIKNWPVPTCLKELRGILGLTGYYRKFIKHYSMISRPLTMLLKKGVKFVWTAHSQEAFQILKQALAPVLAIPDFQQPFVLETDASDCGVGAVLMQAGHPVAYLSKALSPKNQTLSVYEKGCLAILLAVEKWRSYLQHQEFMIRTDHKSLLYLTEQRITSRLQHKALIKLMDLRFKIQYKKGVSNAAADALSRHPQLVEVYDISGCVPTWMDKIQLGYKDDPFTQQLITALSVAADSHPHFTLQDGIVRFKGRVWVGDNKIAQQHILQALHSSGLGGHSGFHATYYRVKKLFAWPKMKDDIKKFVTTCEVCQQAKVEHVKLPGLLQPLPIPDQAWSIVSLDFIEGLPCSNRYNAILVVVDKLTKYSHFMPLVHPFTALQVAQLFVDQIYKLHGLPQILISDRDRIFTSAVWQELFRLTGTTLMMSSSYHPQTDGQTERVNQCLENFLRCVVHSCPRKWHKWIALAEFWYNTTFHSALGRSPFEVLVRWTSLPDSMATWEEEIDLRRRYPKAPAWGQAGIEGGGVCHERQHQWLKKAEEESGSEALAVWAVK